MEELNQNVEDTRQQQLGKDRQDKLAGFEKIKLTGDLIKDIQSFAAVSGADRPDLFTALTEGDKNKLQQIIQEWINLIDTDLNNPEAAKEAMPFIPPTDPTVLTKERELLATILESSK